MIFTVDICTYLSKICTYSNMYMRSGIFETSKVWPSFPQHPNFFCFPPIKSANLQHIVLNPNGRAFSQFETSKKFDNIVKTIAKNRRF